MDEPTAALTEYDVTRLFDIVRRLKARGVGIIYISHRMDEIFALADRVTVLRDGAQVGDHAASPTRSSAELVQIDGRPPDRKPVSEDRGARSARRCWRCAISCAGR